MQEDRYMIQLFSEGAYLVDGTTLVKESEAEALKQLTGEVVSKEEASKNTIAYGILRDHNTSGNMEKLQIKFDKLTSHDCVWKHLPPAPRTSCPRNGHSPRQRDGFARR